MKIARNRAKCLVCGDVIESKHRHDFVTCSCGNLSVDGGKDYLRRSYKDDRWEDKSEMKNALRDLLDVRNINVKSFAEKNGIALSNMYYMLRNDADLGKIGIRKFKRIADGLGMPMSRLYALVIDDTVDDTEESE